MTPAERMTAARRELVAAHEALQAELAVERGRRRGQLVRELHEVRRMLDAGYRFASQAGKDAVVDRLLGGKRGGTFVDVGGYDGVTGSNTYFLEVWRGWTGVLVEPVRAQIARARQVRRCPCLEVAVAAREGSARFIAVTGGYTQMSGLADSYDPTLLARVRQDPRHEEEVVRVPTRPLAALLTEAGIEHPDFISLDIEGGEMEVLESFPFERHRVAIWAIENNAGSPGIAALMRGKGYDLVEFCGPDEVYRLRTG